MFSKSMLAAGLVVIAGLAVANPIQKNTVHERQAIEKQNSPDYCQVLGNERASRPYWYIDASGDCQNAGLGNECCMTVMKTRFNAVWTEQDRNDLMVTIAEQYKKEGRFDTSNHGIWRAQYDTTIFAPNDRVNSELLQIWFNIIKNIILPETEGMGDIIFQIPGGTDDIDNYMVVVRTD